VKTGPRRRHWIGVAEPQGSYPVELPLRRIAE
jgi:hypothetical protein